MTKETSLAVFCQYIPIRLNDEERVLLKVLEQCLHVSEYTDHVDIAGRRGNKVRRILDGILEATHIATGLTVASGKEFSLTTTCHHSSSNNNGNGNGTTGNAMHTTTTTTEKSQITNPEDMMKELQNNNGKKKKKNGKKNGKKSRNVTPPPLIGNIASKLPKDNALLFQNMFEVGRRNKVLNPSSMRTTYGKLMYLLQDAQSPTVAKSLGFSLHKDILLVGPYLQDCNSLLLNDERLSEATRVILDRDDHGTKLDRTTIDDMVARQRVLRQELVDDYSTPKLSAPQVIRILESIRDAFTYVDQNVRPVERMLRHLEEIFDPSVPEDRELSLQLTGASRMSTTTTTGARYGFSAFSTSGSTGPTLSHSHATQYTFCWQSLQLWCKVQRNMHKLWVCADDDLLSISTCYHLNNTGQGLNRVQSCPKVAKVMRQLLSKTQSEAGAAWVGLSVIHLGDRDVPNALMFIDKYTQIPRFLNPIVAFLDGLDHLEDDFVLRDYITKNFGSPTRLQKLVLCDYFKHGFDGSGDDGGSCIDGRLTSSWNWTSLLAKKKYYHAFMLSGFQGFDGDFK